MGTEHVAIVGGGLLGLSLADRLRARGDRVTVFEAAPEVGGLAAAIDERQRFYLDSVAYLTRLRDSEDALMRASRVSLASEMVAAVSHELAQPLSAARSHVRALKRRLEQPRHDRRKDVADIDAAVVQIDSAASTIRDMREFLRRGETDKAALDLEHLVRTATDLVGPELRRASIKLAIDGFAGLPPVLANRTQIAQVILNLVRNGRDAIMETGRRDGAIRISAPLPADFGPHDCQVPVPDLAAATNCLTLLPIPKICSRVKARLTASGLNPPSSSIDSIAQNVIWVSSEGRPSAKVGVWMGTSRWVMMDFLLRCTNSIGSSIVMMWRRKLTLM